MKLVFIRHADPNYEIDSLTEKGWREAKLLATYVAKWDVKKFYCSPLGRARATAGVTLDLMHRQAQTCDWMREFEAPVLDPESGKRRIPWDLKPAYWTKQPEFFDKDAWFKTPIMQTGDVEAEYKRVCAGIDEIIKQHGYMRNENYYQSISPNTDTIVLFCHFGVTAVMMSHILNIPTPLVWQGFCIPPTGVTVLQTEEQSRGTVYFRCRCLGSTTHLYKGSEPVSNSGMYAEMHPVIKETENESGNKL